MSRGYADLADGNQAARVLLVGSDYDSSVAGPRSVAGTLNGVNPGVIAAAGNYDANDILSQSASNGVGLHWVFDAIAPTGGAGFITKALITCSATGLLCRFRLHLFNAVPTGELDDNAAMSIVIADRAKWIGYLDFPAMANLGTMSAAMNDTVRFKFDCASADDALYGVLVTLDAETNEAAGMTVAITLSVDP